MEYMAGGEFFSVLESMGQFSERNAALAMRDIITGVSCLHVHGIIHRDLKPENLLCTSKKWPLNIKIGDFGLAGYTDDEREATPIGTLFYMAPEVLKRENYGTEVDMWSLGVILYVILSGKQNHLTRLEPVRGGLTCVVSDTVQGGYRSMETLKPSV
mmetsp:Transcript_29808/g.114443  ORF Transcript_29808/g.114443 Transcript_29808/m.114443 type:complete len:157 (-) Transcript_29808:500-970(-)